MANALFDHARESFLGQTVAISWASDTIKVALVRGYTVSLSTHQYLSDVTGGGGGTIVGTPQALGSKTVTAGVANAAGVTFTAVASGTSIPYLVIYKDTGTSSTSPLIAYIDTATNLPAIPNGGDISIAWDTGANKIFKL